MNKEKQIDEMVEIASKCMTKWLNSETSKALPNYIAEENYTAGYRKQEWISVDERLPEEDGEYLTWNGLIYYLIWFNASLGLWNVSEEGDTSTAIRDVTHWMPLPEAPKMKGGAE